MEQIIKKYSSKGFGRQKPFYRLRRVFIVSDSLELANAELYGSQTGKLRNVAGKDCSNPVNELVNKEVEKGQAP